MGRLQIAPNGHPRFSNQGLKRKHLLDFIPMEYGGELLRLTEWGQVPLNECKWPGNVRLDLGNVQLVYIWSMAILRIRAGSIVDDKRVLTWEGKWIIGCDALAQEYHAVGVDSNGVSFILRGQIDRDQLIMESMGELPMKLRFNFRCERSPCNQMDK